jgi:hypothetical protein
MRRVLVLLGHHTVSVHALTSATGWPKTKHEETKSMKFDITSNKQMDMSQSEKRR